MFTSKTLTITDDSGFLAIVDADKYKSFVHENWEYNQLLNHFVDQMNNNSLIIWATGKERVWKIYFTDKQSSIKLFREFSTTINVTDRRLYLTNYEDLTMAAQFEDENIPSNHNQDLLIDLNNGIYNAAIRQLFNSNHDEETDITNFEVILQKVDSANSKQIDKVFWLTQ